MKELSRVEQVESKLTKLLTTIAAGDVSILPSPRDGLCKNVNLYIAEVATHAPAPRRQFVSLANTFETWEHYSGDHIFPIKGEEHYRDAEREYKNMPKWSGYGLKMRMSLAAHLATNVRKIAEDIVTSNQSAQLRNAQRKVYNWLEQVSYGNLSIVETKQGLCNNLCNVCIETGCYINMFRLQDAFECWPDYSGCRVYPIKSDITGQSAVDAYWRTATTGAQWTGQQHLERRKLANHLLDNVSKFVHLKTICKPNENVNSQ